MIQLAGLGVLGLSAWTAVLFVSSRDDQERQIEALQAEKAALQQVVQRLGTRRRVADMLVTGQETRDGRLQTDVLFVEINDQGHALPPKRFTITGDVVHIDAWVIQFDDQAVQEADPLRGHSVHLFRRIYGEDQAPSAGYTIDPPGEAPAAYRVADPTLRAFEQDLWADFWRLTDDPAYRSERGVRLANGEVSYARFRPGVLYTVEVKADGGMSLTNRDMEPVYAEALARE
ncbi:MAG: hypothetical protein ACFCVE_13675 [Phycisphaerae bacterium]